MKPFNTLRIQTRSVQPAWSIRRVRMCRDSPKPRLPRIFQLFINVKFDNTICIIKMGPCLYQSRLGSFIVQITDNVSVRKMLCPQQNSNQCTQQLYNVNWILRTLKILVQNLFGRYFTEITKGHAGRRIKDPTNGPRLLCIFFICPICKYIYNFTSCRTNFNRRTIDHPVLEEKQCPPKFCSNSRVSSSLKSSLPNDVNRQICNTAKYEALEPNESTSKRFSFFGSHVSSAQVFVKRIIQFSLPTISMKQENRPLSKPWSVHDDSQCSHMIPEWNPLLAIFRKPHGQLCYLAHAEHRKVVEESASPHSEAQCEHMENCSTNTQKPRNASRNTKG